MQYVSMMRQHTAAVVRDAGGKFVVADMPFLSYRKGVSSTLSAAQANAVRLEGATGHGNAIQRLVESGKEAATHRPPIFSASSSTRKSGAFALVLECVPTQLASSVTAALKIPVIGIGSCAGCYFGFLGLQNPLGLNADFHLPFVRCTSSEAQWQESQALDLLGTHLLDGGRLGVLQRLHAHETRPAGDAAKQLLLSRWFTLLLDALFHPRSSLFICGRPSSSTRGISREPD